LHRPQPGAQNQRTVGPEISGSSETRRALGRSLSDVAGDESFDATFDEGAVDAETATAPSLVVESLPHAAMLNEAMATARETRSTTSP
jgi:hypothetical protein